MTAPAAAPTGTAAPPGTALLAVVPRADVEPAIAPRAAEPVVLAWAEHLDALEEWLRRVREAVERGEVDAVAPPACTPAGDLPRALRTRAAAALQSLERLAGLAEQRRRELSRAEAYSRY